jgi:hypothetical protein
MFPVPTPALPCINTAGSAGLPDILVLDTFAGEVLLFSNLPGAFGRAVVATGLASVEVGVAADVNGDGAVDAVVASNGFGSNSAHLLLNGAGGTGVFTVTQLLTGSTTFRGLAMVDVTGG